MMAAGITNSTASVRVTSGSQDFVFSYLYLPDPVVTEPMSRTYSSLRYLSPVVLPMFAIFLLSPV